MTEQLIQYLEWAASMAKVWGPFLIFFFMTIESSFIPFPSEIVMIPAGFLAARGELPLGDPTADIMVAILVGTLGSLTGAYINYFLFARLGTPFLDRYGKYFGLPPHKLRRAEAIFREYGAGATFACRLIPGIRQLISIPAGLSRMRHVPFALCTFAGAGIWVTFLTLLGHYMGTHTTNMSYGDLLHKSKEIIGANTWWIIASTVSFFIAYVYIHNKVMGSKEAA